MSENKSASYSAGQALGMQPLPGVCPGDFFDPAIPPDLDAEYFRMGFLQGLVVTVIRTRVVYSSNRVWHTEA